MNNINNLIINRDKFFIGVISDIVKGGYIVNINGNDIFINDSRSFVNNESVVIGVNNGRYIILNKYNQTTKNTKSVKIR